MIFLYLLLSFTFINSNALAEIVFKNCRGLEPNFFFEDTFTINFQEKFVKHISNKGNLTFFKIKEKYGNVITAGDMVAGDNVGSEALNAINNAIDLKLTFDLERKKFTFFSIIKSTADPRIIKILKDELKSGKIKETSAGFCDVENSSVKKELPRAESGKEKNNRHFTSFW